MGDIAEMMLDGTPCEGCGTYLGRVDGFPQRCRSCTKDAPSGVIQSPKVACQRCGRRVKASGLMDHIRDAHPERGAA
ncbi:hypothetical protein [Pandoraea apista]|uniref:hypothetical protein n=1 Tax=Pandoraea apista TaxID=93218 RepID=UPI000657ACE8|nr:hypothetical protein [Pandoraea apista]ALS63598.1 hypothetical protein AT395_00060 [Pandoraea apista]CFB63125.1 hypothetical protein LMG16407_03200 [Pandoraea apista]